MNKIKIIGVGPGDPELVTVKAVRVLREADVVYVPESDAGGRSVAEKIISPYVSKEKIRLSYFPMTNDEEELDRRYVALAEEVTDIMLSGKKVAYVTLGDGMLYSTALYLSERLKRKGVCHEFIPGIPSYVACANLIQIPLAEKRECFAIAGVPENTEGICGFVDRFNTVAFMKISKRLPVLLEYVKKYKPKTAMLVCRGTLDGEKIVDLTQTEGVEPDAGYLAIAFIKKGD
ncbi:MAG: precorrin-2 C(20)-methyltransferase [Deferribacteraceae bacterium]|jgi:precorrin-2 C(20)-methyltransferase|nr:precorrin-2 C(20)-methyltransferase [Deferribacteraceae bacterium]